MKKIGIALLLPILVACSPETAKKAANFYDLKSFVESQAKVLNQIKPLTTKVVEAEGATENKQTKDIDWVKELDLFAQADINKASYTGSYQVNKEIPNTLVYQLKEGENLTVKLLKIVLDPKTQQPIQVEATLQNQNYLFESEKKIDLTCQQSANQWQIKNYQIQGYQRLIFGDKKTFSIKGSL